MNGELDDGVDEPDALPPRMSDTPRTDAAIKAFNSASNVTEGVLNLHASMTELETENAALLAALEAIAKAPFHDSDLASLIDTHRAIAKKAIVDAKGGQA